MRNTKICMFLLVLGLMTLCFSSVSNAAETDYSSSLKGNSTVTIVVVEKEDASSLPDPSTGNSEGEGTSNLPGSGSGKTKRSLLPKTGSVTSTLYSLIGAWMIILIALWKKGQDEENKISNLNVD